MSLKCSESSERARQTGSTALEGTSRNAPKAIKRLSYISDDRTGPYWPGASGPGAAAFTSPEHPCCARTPAAPTGPVCRYRPGPRSAGASLGPGVPHQVLLFHVFRRPYSGGAFLPSRLSGLRRRGQCRAGCRAVAERSGRGGKGPRMCCWSKWPVGQSDPIGYWLVAAAVLEPEPLPTVVITTTTTKGRWRIKGCE
jgi:hypothetical protein